MKKSSSVPRSMLAGLFTIALLPNLGQQAIADQSAQASIDATQPSSDGVGQKKILSLHEVVFAARVRLGALWLLSPKSVDSIRVLHAYRFDEDLRGQCNSKDKVPPAHLGFAAFSYAEALPSARVFAGDFQNYGSLDLIGVCRKSKGVIDGNAILLTRYSIPNEDHIALYWTNVSGLTALDNPASNSKPTHGETRNSTVQAAKEAEGNSL